MDMSPQTRRYLDLAVTLPENRSYKEVWPKVLNDEPSRIPRIALAILANFGAHIEGQLIGRGDDLSREARVLLNNDLWFVSDLIEEIVETMGSDTTH